MQGETPSRLHRPTMGRCRTPPAAAAHRFALASHAVISLSIISPADQRRNMVSVEITESTHGSCGSTNRPPCLKCGKKGGHSPFPARWTRGDTWSPPQFSRGRGTAGSECTQLGCLHLASSGRRMPAVSRFLLTCRLTEFSQNGYATQVPDGDPSMGRSGPVMHH